MAEKHEQQMNEYYNVEPLHFTEVRVDRFRL